MALSFSRRGSGWILGKDYSQRVVGHWHRLLREMMESLPLEVFNKCGDMAQRDVVSGHVVDGSTVGLNDLGLDDLSGLLQP